MRIGVIGTGRIGAFHAATLARHTAVTELVLADAVPGRAQELAQRLGAQARPSAEDVFSAGVDAVVIAAATSAHPELIVQAARAGVPAFCEKPIGLDYTEVLKAWFAVREAGVPLQMGFMRRFDAGYAAAREAVRAGGLGRLHTVRAITSDPAPPPAGYLPLSGGLYRDCLVHDFDIMQWVTGQRITEVYATGSDAGPGEFRAAGDVDTAAVLLAFEEGLRGTATATRVNGAGYDVRLELAGERDQIMVGLGERTPARSVEPGARWPAGQAWRDFLERFAPAYEAELDAFVELVRGGRENPCPEEPALYAQLVAEACEVSRRERRPVRVAEAAARAGVWRWQRNPPEAPHPGLL